MNFFNKDITVYTIPVKKFEPGKQNLNLNIDIEQEEDELKLYSWEEYERITKEQTNDNE